MIRFINIKTKERYNFDSWNIIIEKGGIKNVLSKESYNDIYNYEAILENLRLNFLDEEKRITFEKILILFDE